MNHAYIKDKLSAGALRSFILYSVLHRIQFEATWKKYWVLIEGLVIIMMTGDYIRSKYSSLSVRSVSMVYPIWTEEVFIETLNFPAHIPRNSYTYISYSTRFATNKRNLSVWRLRLSCDEMGNQTPSNYFFKIQSIFTLVGHRLFPANFNLSILFYLTFF